MWSTDVDYSLKIYQSEHLTRLELQGNITVLYMFLVDPVKLEGDLDVAQTEFEHAYKNAVLVPTLDVEIPNGMSRYLGLLVECDGRMYGAYFHLYRDESKKEKPPWWVWSDAVLLKQIEESNGVWLASTLHAINLNLYGQLHGDKPELDVRKVRLLVPDEH